MSVKYRTFKEWSEDGYIIRKGSKSNKRNDEGVCLFSETQVYKYQYVPEEYNGVKYEENFDFWKKCSPYGLLDRIEKYDIKVSDEDWRSLMYEIERREC